jgi:NAD(P) transhydrogenase subunit alpha
MDEFVGHLTVFVLSCFVGWYVVWKVTPALHTPLMSATNAISGIILVGAMVTTGMSPLFADGGGIASLSSAEPHVAAGVIVALVALGLASINISGGFLVTQRMLTMFKKKQ